MGTFTIRHTDPNPKGQKEGGNVVAYFCTPDLEIVHAVGGNLGADDFLRQAEWAVRLAERLGRADHQEREELASRAHQEGALEMASPRRWNGN